MHIWDASFVALHLDGLQCDYFILGWQQYDLFATWEDLLSQLRALKDPKYTKYSGPSNASFGTGSLSQFIEDLILLPSTRGVLFMNTKTKRITESAMLLAVAIVLELVSKAIIPEMPFGGQLTMASMLPVVLISYRHGVRWGLVSGVCYALLEMALGARTVAAAFQPGYFGDGTMLLNALLMCLLDYLVAFTVLGLGGCFRHNSLRPGAQLALGSCVALG